MNYNLLKEKFNNIVIEENPNSFAKIRVNNSDLVSFLEYLKNDAEFDFDRLSTIIAVDLQDKIELIYDLFSTNEQEALKISTLVEKNSVNSVVSVYKSAYFDECEIYDLFGVNFFGNKNLKRLFMPKGWIGHPLLKNYEQKDERLVWNK